METVIKISIIILLFSIIILLFKKCGDYADRYNKRLTEKAYYEGQVDYANGDIRIKSNRYGCYYWIKSPWDNEQDEINFMPECKE